MWDPYAEFKSAILPNGLTVYVAHWPRRPWEAVGFLIHSGAQHDPVGLEGLSHFVEHAVSENANISKEEICAFFEDCGGMVSLGTTGYSHTYFRFFIPTDKALLAKAFSIFGYMLLSAKIEKLIERERQVIIGEFYRHYPFKFKLDLDVRKHKMLYSGFWLERFVRPLGNPESINKITCSDLQSYYDTYYTPANMSVVMVGGMQLSDVIKLLLESPFAVNKKGALTPLPTPLVDVTLPLENRYTFKASNVITISTKVEVGAYQSFAKIPAGSINSQTIRIAGRILDKLLDNEIRERRAWTYKIQCSQYNFRHFYEFSINCDALVPKAINEIEEVIENCIASAREREDLFEKVKNCIIASNFMVDPTGKEVCDDVIDDLAENQRIISLAEINDELKSVTMYDIREFLNWIQPERRWTIIMRP